MSSSPVREDTEHHHYEIHVHVHVLYVGGESSQTIYLQLSKLDLSDLNAIL